MILAAKYSFPPNKLGYCGSSSFSAALQKKENIEEQLKTFHAYKYLALIARENGLDPFDDDVARAFWTGNELLEISKEAMQDFIMEDLLPHDRSRARKLSENLPEGILPHHSFNVLYVQFVTDSVPRTIGNFDSCCVTAAQVLSVAGEKAKVMRHALVWEDGFAIREKEDEVDLAREGFRFVDPEKGDWISVHWGMAIEKLDEKCLSLLQKYTKINIDACNSIPVGFNKPL